MNHTSPVLHLGQLDAMPFILYKSRGHKLETRLDLIVIKCPYKEVFIKTKTKTKTKSPTKTSKKIPEFWKQMM